MKTSNFFLAFVFAAFWVFPIWVSQSTANSSAQIPHAAAAFGKVEPANGATNLLVSDIVLQWGSNGANMTYQYCIRVNPSSCPSRKWINAGANTSITLQGLSPNKVYYWQVRASSNGGTNWTYADGNANAWWSFKTIDNTTLPGTFVKTLIADDAINQPLNGLVLTWTASTNVSSYEYCLDDTNDNICTGKSWTNVGTVLTATINGLSYGTIYYWQVRAVNLNGRVQADNGVWFNFETVPGPPGAFSKAAPLNFAVNQNLSTTLSWSNSAGGGIHYEYCLQTTNTFCSSNSWISVNTSITVNVSLQYQQEYWWQVRAVNLTSTTYADGAADAMWKFSTPPAPPSAFTKTSPADKASAQPLNMTLNWNISSGDNVVYQYCIVKSPATCDPDAQGVLSDSLGASPSASINGLDFGQTYYWQVSAKNIGGTTYADQGNGHKFTTVAEPPRPFGKLNPAAASTELAVNLSLSWSNNATATDFFYCVDTSSHADGDIVCNSSWVNVNLATNAALNSLLYNTTYYWQVKAHNSQGDVLADGGHWWSFTTVSAAPLAFGKISPADAATDQTLTPTLTWWTPVTPGNTYQYCIYETACTTWTTIVENAPIVLSSALNYNTTYHWQVRASSTGNAPWTGADTTDWTFHTLLAPPTPPAVDARTFSTPENTVLNGTLNVAGNYPLSFYLYGASPAGQLTLNVDGTFVYTPVQYYNGAVTFKFIVSDGHNPPIGPYTATINMTQVNNPPVLNAIANQSAGIRTQVTFYAYAVDPDRVYGDTLTYSIVEALPAGASMDAATGLFNWVVPKMGSQVFNFTVRATDSHGLYAERVVKITITAKFVFYIPVIGN